MDRTAVAIGFTFKSGVTNAQRDYMEYTSLTHLS